MGVDIARGDILDRASIASALDGCDTLFHAAALYDLWGLDAAEQIAFTYVEKGLPLVCVNPAGIYGPGDRKPTGRFIVSLLNGRVPALFPGWMSLVYIDDAVRGHVLAADKGQIGARYILSGTVDTFTALGGLACRLAGRRPPLAIPAALAAPYAMGGEALSRLTRRPPVLSWETYRLAAHGFRADGSKAAGELGLQYTNGEKGLAQTINWCWEQGLLESVTYHISLLWALDSAPTGRRGEPSGGSAELDFWARRLLR